MTRTESENTAAADDSVLAKPKRAKRVGHSFVTSDGAPLVMTSVPKFQRDTLIYRDGTIEHEGSLYTVYDYPCADAPPLVPGPDSPICKQCKLIDCGAKIPFMPYAGPTNPLVTIVMDSVSYKEDDRGGIGKDGPTALICKIIEDTYEEHGVALSEIRFAPLTRCASRVKGANYKAAGGWCRDYLVDDLRRHTPSLIMPVGSVALGALSYKSNAQDWGGRLLTYRGWPDDWLTDPDYMLPRPDPSDIEGLAVLKEAVSAETDRVKAEMPKKECAPENALVLARSAEKEAKLRAKEEKKLRKARLDAAKDTAAKSVSYRCVEGHPVFGLPPMDVRVPMVPIQSPRLIYMMQNPRIVARWKQDIVNALKLARKGTVAPSYTRPWYRVSEDVEEVEGVLTELCEHPGILLCYDTETTGLKPLAENAAIVFMMLRWDDPVTKEPKSLGFPWDFDTSVLKPHLKRLTPLVLKVLAQSTLLGHNLTFDVLYTHFTVGVPSLEGMTGDALIRRKNELLCALASAAKNDTWHMRYTLRQERGSLGLEILVYDYCPDLAGYEEDMTLLIELHREKMHPAAGKGGHYANCPKDKWATHLVPYVMGDVEGCRGAYDKIVAKMEDAKTYRIPLAHPRSLSNFRLFEPPSRKFVYSDIMSPAARTLMKLMGRGMCVDMEALRELESSVPLAVITKRNELEGVSSTVTNWVKDMRHMHPDDFEFDLESKDVLRQLLFEQLKMPVQRLTKGGRKLYGEDETKWEKNIKTFLRTKLGRLPTPDEMRAELLEKAALDKFTLNKLAVDFKEVRPLQEYRKVHKLWSTYVRPLRNSFNSEIDTKPREKEQHLCSDGMIHAQFMLTGTRGGRLSCRDPNLQQLPRKGDAKKMFVSRFGARGCLYQADLSQIELRLLAAGCGDPTMVKAYFDGTDLHTLTASRIFNLPYEHFTKEHMGWLQEHNKHEEAKELSEKRSIGKTTNFLTGYGGGAFGLQTTLANNGIYLPLEECEVIIDSFFNSYPSLQRHLQLYKKFIMEKAVAVSLFGRVRVFEEVRGEDKEFISKALRAGCNHLIQATASDMMLVALIVIEALMQEAGLESMLVSTVHDSLLIDAVRSELPVLHEIVYWVLNNFHEVLPAYFGPQYDTSWMLVPFAGDCELGVNYYDMTKVEAENNDWDKLLAVKKQAV